MSALGVVLLTAAAPAPMPKPGRETNVMLPYQRAQLGQRTAEAVATPWRLALARRPAITAAFARYWSEGGLLPRLRFAQAYADAGGFAHGRPLAFDLVCAVPARSGFAVRPFGVSPHPIGGSVPLPGTTVRISADAPAAVWRGERGPLEDASSRRDGVLTVSARAGAGEIASGRLMIDGVASVIDDTRRIVEAATGRVRVNALRLACTRVPFSGLFGVGAPTPPGGR